MSACVCSALGSAICKQNGFPARDNAVPIEGRAAALSPTRPHSAAVPSRSAALCARTKRCLSSPIVPRSWNRTKPPNAKLTTTTTAFLPSLFLFFSSPTPNAFFFFCNAGIFCCFSTARSWKAAAVGISLSRDGAPPGGGAGGQRRPRAFVGEKEEKKRQRGLSRARTARGAGRGNAQCMGARIQIENRWDFSRQPDIRGRGRRGETSPSGPAAKRYGREGPKNPRSVQNPSSLRLLGLPARQRAARRAGLFLMLCEVWFYRSVSDSSAPARWSPAQPGAHSLPQETFEGRSAPTQVPPYMYMRAICVRAHAQNQPHVPHRARSVHQNPPHSCSAPRAARL